MRVDRHAERPPRMADDGVGVMEGSELRPTTKLKSPVTTWQVHGRQRGRWLLGLGIAVALVGSYELLMVIICGAQVPADVPDVAGVPDRVRDADRLQVQAAQEFAAEFATGRVPSVRAAGTGPTWPPSPADNSRRAARTSVATPDAPPGTSGRFVTRRDALTETARKRSACVPRGWSVPGRRWRADRFIYGFQPEQSCPSAGTPAGTRGARAEGRGIRGAGPGQLS
jgi:hypothetical protein